MESTAHIFYKDIKMTLKCRIKVNLGDKTLKAWNSNIPDKIYLLNWRHL